MKKHNSIKVVLITLVIFILLAWIIPAAYFQTELVEQGRVSVGLFDLSNYFTTTISYFGYVALFFVVIGAFYGILYKIPAYRNMLDKIAENLKGNEKLYIIVTIMVFSVLTSLCGVQLALLIFFPFVTSIILLLGYDKMVVALTLVGSTMAGIIGTTTAYSNVYLLFQYLSLDGGIKTSMMMKVAILIFSMVAVMITTLRYINKKAFVTGNRQAAKKTITTVKETVKADKVEEKPKATTTKRSSSSTKKSSSAKSTKKSTTSRSTKSGSKSSGNRTRKSGSSQRRNNNKAFAVQRDVIVVKDDDTNNNGLVPTIVDSTHKIWPLFLTLFVVLIIVFLSFMPWKDAFGLEFMTKATSNVSGFKVANWCSLLIGLIILSAISLCTKNKVKNVIRNDIIYLVFMFVAFFAQYGFHLKKLKSFFVDKNTLFAKIFGTFNAFGSWTINEVMLVLFVAAIFLILVYKVKFDDVVDGAINGIKKAVVPTFVVIMIYTLLVLATYHPFQLEIYKFILKMAKNNYNLFTTSLVSILASVFNADPLYTANSFVPYFASVIQDTAVYPKVAVIVQSMYGLTMLVAPTSVVLMAALSYLNISFKDWFKAIWKLLFVLLIVLLFVFAIWKSWFAITLLVLSIVIFALYLIMMKN